jgi:predicted O-methyltransferase YrrM
MSKLNTGWKKWDLYLSKFTEHDAIHILEIGSYKGDSALWFLNNLCVNKKTTLTCIDTWMGSPEYNEFEQIEQIFDKNISENERKDQLIKIKNNSYDALVELNYRKEKMYDVIYIDASHESRDVISDASLSWRLLNPSGILIFDDYKWDLLKPDYFTPKPAIDAFMYIMKPELKVIDVARQVFVEKLTNFEKPQKKNKGGKTSRKRSYSKKKNN